MKVECRSAWLLHVTVGTAAIFRAGTAPRQRYQGLIRSSGHIVQGRPL